MSGILGLNMVEKAALNNMGIASFRTKGGKQLVTLMRNPKTHASEFHISDLSTGDIVKSGGISGPNADVLTQRLLNKFRLIADNVEDFENAVERSLNVVV